jgi:hypothetical protein
METRRREMQVRGESAGSPALHDTSRPNEAESSFSHSDSGIRNELDRAQDPSTLGLI